MGLAGAQGLATRVVVAVWKAKAGMTAILSALSQRVRAARVTVPRVATLLVMMIPDADIHTRWTMAGREIWNTWRISTQSIFQGPLKSMRNSLSRKKATCRP